VQPTQINVLTPPDTASGPAEVDVITNNHGVATANVNMTQVSPALFTYALQGAVYAAAQFASDYATVAAVGAMPGATSRPAKSGDYVLLYAAGLGPTNPPYPIGSTLDRAYPIASLSQVQVMIDGQPAQVLFAGITFPGVFQVNVKIPDGIGEGDLPVVLQLGSLSSQQNVVLTFGM
jgi:uncharacterized protein (TIGR03437 family)